MAARSVVSVGQLTTLIDYLEDHNELALGRINRTTEGRSRCKRLWEDCAVRLNSMSADGTEKSAEQWRIYYNEYKSKLLGKIRKNKSERSATGGGKAVNIRLTPLQERLYSILGRDVGEPLPGVRHNPLSQNMGTVHLDGPRIQNNNENDMRQANLQNVPFDQYEVEVQAAPESENLYWRQENFQVAPIPPAQHEVEVEPAPDIENFNRLLDQPDSDLSDLDPNNANPPSRQHQQSLPRRRRPLQRGSSNILTPRPEETVQEPTMREAAARLEQMEHIQADALREHAAALRVHVAGAINRLAAAMEAIAERLIPLQRSPVPTRRQDNIDSEPELEDTA